MNREQRDALVAAAKEVADAAMAYAYNTDDGDRLAEAWTAFYKALGGDDSHAEKGE